MRHACGIVLRRLAQKLVDALAARGRKSPALGKRRTQQAKSSERE